MLQFGMELIVLVVELVLISIFPAANVYPAHKDLCLMLAFLNVFVPPTNLIFKMECVYLVNIQQHGIQIQTLAFLHVFKINIGTITLTNVHGVLTELLYGMEIYVLNVQQEHFISEIGMFV